MNREQLYDGVTEIRDDLVDQAATPLKRSRRWGPWAAALAAVLVLALVLPNMGGASDSGGREGRTYMYYTGPVLPLTALEAPEGLTAARHTEYDFSPIDGDGDESYLDQYGQPVTYQSGRMEAIVTETYTLSNATDQPMTVTLAYPFVASLDRELRYLPRLSVDGAGLEGDLRIGGTIEEGEGSWEDYAALLGNGTYRANALSEALTVDQPVVVYELTGASAAEEAPAATLEFTADLPAGVRLLSYGSSGGTVDETGGSARHFSIFRPGERQHSQCILLLGGDLTDYAVQAYADGGCDEGEEIEASWEVVRYESTLGQMLEEFYAEQQRFRNTGDQPTILERVSSKVYLGLMAQHVERFGLAAAAYPGRNFYDDLTALFSANTAGQRVFYLTCSVTIPANGQTQVRLAMHREAHQDHTGSGKGRYGYDLLTTLDSSLTFTEQTASIANWDNIRIIGQNFGFDLKKGVTQVTLDPSEPYYWMDIRKK